MAYNVRQLKQLQEDIGSEDRPSSFKTLNAFQGLKREAMRGRPQRRPQRRNTFQPRTMQEGGQLDMMDDAQNIASKGRYGDTMLMHVTPDEVRGLSSLRGGITINPETGLPEAFDPITMALIGAAIGGVGSAATGGDPIKGAILGGIGGFMPTALGGLAGLGGTGLASAWNWLGPIGQGMLSGAAMGGVRSLFGDSDNPLRDILIGGALGGVGGAAFGEGPSFGGEAAASAVDATALGTPAVESAFVPAYGEAPTGIAGAADRYASSLAGVDLGATVAPPPAITDISSAATVSGLRPPTVQSTAPLQTTEPNLIERLGRSYFKESGQKGFDWGKGIRGDAVTTPTTTLPPTSISEAADIQQASLGQPNWWDRQSDLAKYGMMGGAGLVAATALGEQPVQAEIPGLRTIAAIPELDPFTPRTPIGGRNVEFYERTIGEGRTPEEARYFEEEEEEEDVNVAKKGGVIGRPAGGLIRQPGPLLAGPGGQQPPAGFTYVPGIGPQGMSVLKPISEVGGTYAQPQYYQKAVLTPGGGGGGAPAPSPFEFPDVDPFRSGLSSFNVEDRLARIEGQAQAPQLPVVLPEQVAAPVPVNIPVPTDTSALGDLLARFQQTEQVDPIARLVAPAVGANQGGTVGLANGGIFEGRVQGQGDGMADQIAFNVVPQTPQDIPNTPDMALLSSDEYVVPADVVSMLGNGSSTAGAQALDQFNQLMRKKAFGTNKQQRELNAGRELSSLV